MPKDSWTSFVRMEMFFPHLRDIVHGSALRVFSVLCFYTLEKGLTPRMIIKDST